MLNCWAAFWHFLNSPSDFFRFVLPKLNANWIQFSSWVGSGCGQVLYKDVLFEMQDCCQNTLSQWRQIIGMGVRDFAHEPMQAQSFEQPTNAATTPVFKHPVQATRGQSAQCILAAQHRLEGLGILFQERIESPITAS